MDRRSWTSAALAALVVTAPFVAPVGSAQAAGTPVSLVASTLRTPLAGGGTIVTGTRAVPTYSPVSGGLRFTLPGFGARSFDLFPPSGGSFVVGPATDVPVTTATSGGSPVAGHMTLNTWFGSLPCGFPSATTAVTIDRADYDVTGPLTAFTGHLELSCTDSGATYAIDLRYASSESVVNLAFVNESFLKGPAAPPPAGTTGVTTVPLRNAGTTDVTVGSMTVAAAAAGWTTSVDPGTCASATLAPAATCTAQVSWTSDGTATTAELTVASPDAQTPSITTTLRTYGTPSAATILTARDAVDGVALSWSAAPGYPSPNVWDVFRRTGAGWDQLAAGLSAPAYADLGLALGQSADYRVVGRRTVGPVAGAGDGNVVSVAHVSTPPAYDPAVQVEQVSIPTRSVVAGRYLSVSPAVTAPGVYDVPGDVTARSFSDNGIGCGTPTGTLTVRDVVTSAANAYLRMDWSFRGTCADGTPVATELRIGAPGTPFATVDVSRIDTDFALPRGIYVGQPTSFGVRVVNRTASPMSVAAGTLDRGGSPASWWSHEGQCGVTIAPQSECIELWTVRPRTPWSGTATLNLPGVGLLGETVASQTINALPDTTAPHLTVAPASLWADDRTAVRNATWTDSQSGPSTEDVRVRTASFDQTRIGPWTYRPEHQGIDANDVTVPVAALSPGTQTCVSLRARDLAGNVTPWSRDRCQATAIDDTALGWYSARGASDWRQYETRPALANGSTYQGATRRGAKLLGDTVHARQIALLGVACPTCGTVSVYIGHTKVGSFSTRSKAWHHRAWFVTPLYGRVQNGAISFVVTSSGKPVYIDGFSVRLV